MSAAQTEENHEIQTLKSERSGGHGVGPIPHVARSSVAIAGKMRFAQFMTFIGASLCSAQTSAIDISQLPSCAVSSPKRPVVNVSLTWTTSNTEYSKT